MYPVGTTHYLLSDGIKYPYKYKDGYLYFWNNSYWAITYRYSILNLLVEV